MTRDLLIAATRRTDGPPRRAALVLPPCEDTCDLAGGCLNSEQRVRWTGPLPSSDVHAGLPGTMDRLHFAAVERSVAGLIRCDVRSGGVDCRILGGWLALQFADPVAEVSERRILRQWSITGGGLARPETTLGMITFGWEAGSDAPEGAEQTLWARVEGYPSRFIRRTRRESGRSGPLSALYARYHGVVTCRYLRGMAAWMMEQAAGTGEGKAHGR